MDKEQIKALLELMNEGTEDGILAQFTRAHEELYKVVEATPGPLRSQYVARVLAFAAMYVADELVWHIEAHDGYKCVCMGVEDLTKAFDVGIRKQVRRLVARKGLRDPFEVSGVNATTTQEILDEIQYAEDAEATNRIDS